MKTRVLPSGTPFVVVALLLSSPPFAAASTPLAALEVVDTEEHISGLTGLITSAYRDAWGN